VFPRELFIGAVLFAGLAITGCSDGDAPAAGQRDAAVDGPAGAPGDGAGVPLPGSAIEDASADNPSTFPLPGGGSPLMGRWTGSYGSGRLGLSFEVGADGQIHDFQLTSSVTVPGCGTGALHEIKDAGPFAVANGSIALDIPVKVPESCGADGACSGVKLQGTFSSAERASGSFDKSLFNRTSICFGSTSTITWTAAKDCSLAPLEGVSATRFCAARADGGVSPGAPDAGPAGCTAGAKRCQGRVPQSCDANGKWQDGAACMFACIAGDCGGSCVPGSKECSGKTARTCDSKGQWESRECPYVCAGDTCGGVCSPGSKRCFSNAVQTCDATGMTWENGATCPVFCVDGMCKTPKPGTWTGTSPGGPIEFDVDPTGMVVTRFKYSWNTICPPGTSATTGNFPIAKAALSAMGGTCPTTTMTGLFSTTGTSATGNLEMVWYAATQGCACTGKYTINWQAQAPP
jgi:hypothetical protein